MSRLDVQEFNGWNYGVGLFFFFHYYYHHYYISFRVCPVFTSGKEHSVSHCLCTLYVLYCLFCGEEHCVSHCSCSRCLLSFRDTIYTAYYTVLNRYMTYRLLTPQSSGPCPYFTKPPFTSVSDDLGISMLTN